MNRISTVFLGLGLALTAAPALAQSLDTASVDRFVQEQMQRFDVPGLGLAIVKDGKVVYTRGYGVRDLGSKTPVNADTLFAIGSSTKSFTSLAVMQQVERGAMKLDASVNTYLPNLRFSDAAKGARVTLRQLLSMTSGLPRADDLWAADPSINTRQRMLETIAKIPFSAEPGTSFQYCNQNYVAAGAALEAVTKQRWEAYVKANIFAPLGMARSVFEYTDAAQSGNVAAGTGSGFSGVQPMPPFDRLTIAGPAGSIHSSANDMARYLAFQMGDGSTGDGSTGDGSAGSTRLVSAQGLNTLHTPQVKLDSGEFGGFPGEAFPAYALGWFSSEYRGVRVVEHGGNINGYTAEMAMLPAQGWGLVLLTNLDSANEFTLTTRLGLTEQLLNLQPRSDFASATYPRTKALLEAARTYRASPAELEALTGQYALVTGDRLRVVFENGKLFAEQQGQRFELMAASKGSFVANVGGAVIPLQFKTDASGLTWLYQGETLVGMRLPSAANTDASNTAPSTFEDSARRYSLQLPGGVQVVSKSGNLTVAQSDNPAAAFVFGTGAAAGSLEQSATALLRQLDPSFDLKPTRSDTLPAVNGIVWTQLLYNLPGNQTLAVLVTQHGDTVYMIAVQTLTANLGAVTPLLQQIVSSYKIL